MNCQPDYVCIAYPGWVLLAGIVAAGVFIAVIAGVALAVDWWSRR